METSPPDAYLKAQVQMLAEALQRVVGEVRAVERRAQVKILSS